MAFNHFQIPGVTLNPAPFYQFPTPTPTPVFPDGPWDPSYELPPFANDRRLQKLIPTTTNKKITTTPTTTTTTSSFAWTPTTDNTTSSAPTTSPTLVVLEPTALPTGTPTSITPRPTPFPTQYAETATTTTITTSSKSTTTAFKAETSTTTSGAAFSPSLAPSYSPNSIPTSLPTIFTQGPSLGPTSSPTSSPSSSPTSAPTKDFLFGSTTTTTNFLTPKPTSQPSTSPTTTTTTTTTLGALINGSNATANFSLPSASPTYSTSQQPSATPFDSPTMVPTMVVTSDPTAAPSNAITSGAPSMSPTSFVELDTTTITTTTSNGIQTSSPTYATISASQGPTYSVTTLAPTQTRSPSLSPTGFIAVNTNGPTSAPTTATTTTTYYLETFAPSPIETNTNAPSSTPAGVPTWTPTAAKVTFAPTTLPTGNNTNVPTEVPTSEVTLSSKPTGSSTAYPTDLKLSFAPSEAPTISPLTTTSLIAPPASTSTSTSTASPNTPSTSVVLIANTTNEATTIYTSLSPTRETTRYGNDFLPIATTNSPPLKPESVIVHILPVSNNEAEDSPPDWITAIAVLGSLGSFSVFFWGLFRHVGNGIQADLNAQRNFALQGQLDIGLQHRAGVILNRVGYFCLNGFNAPTLGDVVNQLVDLNTQAIENANRERAAQSLRTIATYTSSAVNQLVSRGTDIFDAMVPAATEHAPLTLPNPLIIGRPASGFINPRPPGSSSDPRLLSRTDTSNPYSALITTQDKRIVELWGYITKVQQLPISDPTKATALLLAELKTLQIISQGNIQYSDFETLQNILLPSLQKEVDGFGIQLAGLDSTSRLTGTQTMGIEKLNSSSFKWDINFLPTGAFIHDARTNQAGFILGDTNRPIFINENSDVSKLSKIDLDSQNSQYVGSDANETITIGGTGTTTYNVDARGGNDIILVVSETIDNSVVNIFGGAGKNTYVITVQGSWSRLPSTIHIWDFDAAKDSIVFVTSDGSSATPRIQEIKRTLFNSRLDLHALYGDGRELFLKDPNNAIPSSKSWLYDYFGRNGWDRNPYKGAEHELSGEGAPLIVIDEKYDHRNPDSLFVDPNTFRVTPTSDIADTIDGKIAQLNVSPTFNTHFSELSSNSDHDLYKVHLYAGQSYSFTMAHKPGDPALDTKLVLLSPSGNTLKDSSVLTSSKVNGDSRIDYVALFDGDFYLDASGSTNGKYTISSVEIPHVSITPKFLRQKQQVTFDSQINHVGYKMSLKAGDLVQLDFDLDHPGHPGLETLPITINNTTHSDYDADFYKSRWVTTFNLTESTKTITTKTFLANQTGDYYIDVSVPSDLTYSPALGLTYLKKEIAGNQGTLANLAEGLIVNGNLYSNTDHDWYRVSLTSGTKYQFDLRKSVPSSKLDTCLVLRDQNGVQVGVSDDIFYRARRTTDSKLIYTAKESGTYYIDVGGSLNHSSGDFNLMYNII